MPNRICRSNFAPAKDTKGKCDNNQTLKELKCHFSEHRAMALVCKLEKYMMQLVQIMHKVVELTIRYENHRIGKDN